MLKLKEILDELGDIRDVQKSLKKRDSELTKLIKENMTGNTFQSSRFIASLTESKRRLLNKTTLAKYVKEDVLKKCTEEKVYPLLQIKKK